MTAQLYDDNGPLGQPIQTDNLDELNAETMSATLGELHYEEVWDDAQEAQS